MREKKNLQEKENEGIMKLSRQRIMSAVVMTAVLLLLTVFTAHGSGVDGMALTVALLLAVGAGVWVLLDVRFGWLASLALFLFVPLGTVWALENYTHVITDLEPKILLLNLLFFYLLYALCTFLSGSVKYGFLAATLVPMLFGLVNYFVVSFRGSPVVPWDLLSLGTAVSVADNYTFTLTWKASFSIFAFVWLILLASKSAVTLRGWKVRLAPALAFGLLLCGYISGIQKSSVQSFFGMDTTLFTLNVLYRNNGIAAAFLGNLRFLNIEEPDGYSADRAEELISEVCADGEEPGGTQPADYPHVIVIMDEAFSDLSVWGDFETSEDVMPFFKQLQQEAVGGEVYVSVKGGNTANTEFELLTGDTMGFLPAGSVPYQQYINSSTPSLASYLKSLGYTTTAIHPYNRSGWDRDEVYEYFGFDEFLDKNAFSDPLRMRGYISDKSAFEKIIEQFEIREEDEKKFIFEVTMQNHGGYSRETPDFEIYLTLPDVTSKTTSVVATEKYLTLMNQTDRALKELIEYFDRQEEPVIVLMFGDHQPSDYITNVIQRICGVQSTEALQSVEQGYRVPFVMWSNRALEHQYYDGISVNYLGGLLMEQAGIPKTGYQEFLYSLMEQIPVINANVYRTADGTFHNWEEDAEEELLNDYRILQYSHLVDRKHRDDAFFGG